jgi:hypothetical protein
MSTAVARLRSMPRAVEFGSLHETLLITSVSTILAIRTQLWLTNYPQLGGGGLHIAHLLYGGIFMVIAIGLLLTLLGPRPRLPAAIVGGIGFGFFIDELGKFVTEDNNYFFEPAAAIIYIIFVGLFLLVRALKRDRALSPAECLSNAIDLVGDAARRPFDANAKLRAQEMLRGADGAGPLVEPMRRLVAQMDSIPGSQPPWLARRATALRRRYFEVVERPWFGPLLNLVFAVWAVLSLLWVIELALSVAFNLGGAMSGFQNDELLELSIINWATIASGAVSAVLVAIGLWRMNRGAPLDAYRWFARALLVSIFVTQVFAFVESQFHAVFGLAIDLLLFVTVEYMAEQERRRERSRDLEGIKRDVPTDASAVRGE